MPLNFLWTFHPSNSARERLHVLDSVVNDRPILCEIPPNIMEREDDLERHLGHWLSRVKPTIDSISVDLEFQ